MKIKKNIIKMLGIVAIAGMFMVGCSQSTDNNSANTKTQSTSVASESQEKTSEEKTSKDYIGEEKAKAIMQEEAPGAEFVNFEFDEDDGRAEYEGELVKDDTEYDITVDAVTGEILESEQEKYDGRYDSKTDDSNDKKDYISKAHAKNIMKEEVPGAEIVEFEFDGHDDDDNEPATYEGELVKDKTEYDISVDAVTGEVLSVEKETIK